MASRRWKDLRGRIAAYLLEPNEDDSYWSKDLKLAKFNGVYFRRCAELQQAREGWFHRIETLDVVAGQAKYTWPENLARPDAVWIVDTESDTKTPLFRATDRRRTVDTQAVGTHSSWALLGPKFAITRDGFILEPPPPTATTDGIELHYDYVPAPLVGDDSEVDAAFPDMFLELLVLDATEALLSAEAQSAQQRARGDGPVGVSFEIVKWERVWYEWIEQRDSSPQQVARFNLGA